MQRMLRCLAIAAAVTALACASQPAVSTTSRISSLPDYEVALGDSAGMWADSTGGTWMDANGGMWTGRRSAMNAGTPVPDARMLDNASIVSHLGTGDSLEVALSQIGVDRASSSAVRDFARRMVSEHSSHMQMAMQTAMQGGITPASSPADTADAMMAMRVTNRLSRISDNAAFDRDFMRAEVMMHQHMLHDLMTVRPQASGAALQIVDQTMPVVRQHLADARALWRQTGGGMGSPMSSSRR